MSSDIALRSTIQKLQSELQRMKSRIDSLDSAVSRDGLTLKNPIIKDAVIDASTVAVSGDITGNTLDIGDGDATIDADGNWVCPYAEVTEVQTVTVTVENPEDGVDQTITASGGEGEETVTVSNNFTCIDGIFAASTVKIGNQTISADDANNVLILEGITSDDGTFQFFGTDVDFGVYNATNIGQVSAGNVIVPGLGGSGTEDSINITHSSAKQAATVYRAIAVVGDALDPTGAGASIYGLHLDLDGVSMANNPDIYGIKVDLPAAYGTGTEAAGYFEGDGKKVIICDDTYALWVDDGNTQLDGTLGVTGAATLSSTAAITTSLQVAGGAVITTLGDVAALAASDVKIPTNTTVKEYVDQYNYLEDVDTGTIAYKWQWLDPRMGSNSRKVGVQVNYCPGYFQLQSAADTVTNEYYYAVGYIEVPVGWKGEVVAWHGMAYQSTNLRWQELVLYTDIIDYNASPATRAANVLKTVANPFTTGTGVSKGYETGMNSFDFFTYDDDNTATLSALVLRYKVYEGSTPGALLYMYSHAVKIKFTKL